MAAAQVAIPHDINAGLHNEMASKFQQKQQAPPSPDGAEMAPHPGKDVPSKPLPNPPVELQVQPKPTLPVPSIASRIQSKAPKTPEQRKAKITRQATQAFEKQTGKTFTGDDMSPAEWAIYHAEIKKSEEYFEKKRADEEAATMLANNIKYREHHLNEMTNDLARKVEQFQMGQEELAKVTKEFEDMVNAQVAAEAPADVSGVKSSSVRMEEEKKKKALKNAYRHSVSNDPVTQARQRQINAAEEIASLKARIEETRKELGRMLGQASKGKSSSHRMREEQEKKNEQRRSGVPLVDPNAPVKVYVKKEAPVRSHMSRMEEEKQRKAEARRLARQSLDAGELAGRPRSGTTSF